MRNKKTYRGVSFLNSPTSYPGVSTLNSPAPNALPSCDDMIALSLDNDVQPIVCVLEGNRSSLIVISQPLHSRQPRRCSTFSICERFLIARAVSYDMRQIGGGRFKFSFSLVRFIKEFFDLGKK
jgi:hypothetical protein